jgi:hypothetical protein
MCKAFHVDWGNDMPKTRTGLLNMALLAGSCFLLLGCAATPQPPSAINASLENGVRAFEAEVLGSYNGDDPAQAASYYAANAVAFIPE